MGENPRQAVSRRNGSNAAWRGGCRNPDPDLPGRPSTHHDSIDCSSCTARTIADCVALCCCPCAVVNFLTFAFVKVPYMVGRRCLAAGKKRRRRKIARTSCEGEDHNFVVGKDGSLRKEDAEEDGHQNLGVVEEIEGRVSARVEAERVWLELYQIGHLGFGRVSFTGIQ